MPLTFVHSADWHFGYVYHGIGPRARDSAGWRLDAVRRLFDVASEENAAFVLVAGDVFHTETVSAPVMRAAVDLLRDAPVPVVLISGNHDPYAEGSVWRHHEFHEALRGVRHVRLALEPRREVRLDECDTVIYPCPVTQRHTRDDLTSWIPAGQRGGHARIGLAHGHWRGYSGAAGEYNMIASDCADRCGLDYLALGDFHSYTLPDHPAALQRSYYSGTPEISAADDQRAGHVLVVRLDQPGAQPHVTPRAVGRVQVVDWGDVLLSPGFDIDSLRHRAAAIANPQHVLLRATLRGTIAQAARRELDAWINDVRENLLGADIRTDALFTEPTAADFAGLHLEPAEAEVLSRLGEPLIAQSLEGVDHAARIAGWSQSDNALREARSLYYQLLRDARGARR